MFYRPNCFFYLLKTLFHKSSKHTTKTSTQQTFTGEIFQQLVTDRFSLLSKSNEGQCFVQVASVHCSRPHVYQRPDLYISSITAF